MSAIDYPAFFEKKLAKNRSVRAAVDKTIVDFGEWFSDSKLPFFPDYTDHGPRHLAKVLTIAERLIADRSHDAITAEDVAVLILSVVLHDSAMHLSEAGFRSLVKGPISDNRLDAFNEGSWPELWSEFLATATRWDDQRLIELFGADENGAPIAYVHDPFNHYNNLRRSDRDLIGEFLRQHHPRLAHEFGVLGVPGVQGEAVIRPAFDAEVCDLAGLVARSHGLPLRRCLDYLETKYDMREYDNIHPVYLMCLLRVADYLDLGGDRAPTIALRYKDVRSPVSRREFTVNQAFRNISWGNPDPESIKIPARPRDVQAFLQVKDWLSGIQAELDQCWAVLGEVYGASHSGNQELSIRRVRSNVDNLAAFSKTVLYIPRYVEFETARAQLLKLLIEPLYGKNPEIAVRELMQNAVDAVRELWEFQKNHPESTGVQMLEQAGDVEIWFDPPDRNGRRVLRVSDRGIGMTADIICNYFLRAGASFRESDAWNREFTMRGSAGAQHSKVIRSGRFGVGVLAAFLLGNEISVATRHVTESRGIRFKTKLDAGPIQLNYDDSLPVGTTVEIEMYADIFDKFTAGIKYGGPDWDWYCLENPRVVRRSGPTGIILKQAVKIPHAIEKPVSGWNEVPDHRYLSVRLDSHFTQPSMLVCNGIKIKPMASSGYLLPDTGFLPGSGRDRSFGFSAIAERHFFKLKNPLTSVMDPDAIFPLTLRRDDVATKELDFQKAASETQAKAVLAKLLSSTVDELPASDWDRFWNAPMFVPIVFGHQGFRYWQGQRCSKEKLIQYYSAQRTNANGSEGCGIIRTSLLIGTVIRKWVITIFCNGSRTKR
jgi:molecular chaperone HtpG